MNQDIERLRQIMADDRVINDALFSGKDFDAILDNRDSDDFSSTWMRVYNELEAKKAEVKLTKQAIAAVTSIREAVFKKVWNLTGGSELASYVSDDFGLIADALVTGYENEWLNALWASYASGTIPQTALKLVAGPLRDHLRVYGDGPAQE